MKVKLNDTVEVEADQVSTVRFNTNSDGQTVAVVELVNGRTVTSCRPMRELETDLLNATMGTLREQRERLEKLEQRGSGQLVDSDQDRVKDEFAQALDAEIERREARDRMIKRSRFEQHVKLLFREALLPFCKFDFDKLEVEIGGVTLAYTNADAGGRLCTTDGTRIVDRLEALKNLIDTKQASA